MQQTENPQYHGFQNSAYGQGPVDESRRRAFDHHRDRERAVSRGSREWEHEREDRHFSTPGNSDEAGTPGNRSLPPGWGGGSDKDYMEDTDRRDHRRTYFEMPPEPKEEPVRPDVTASRVDSAVYRGSAEYRETRNYDEGHASSVAGRKPVLVRQSSATRPPLPPQPSPAATTQPWIGPLCKSGMQYCEVIAYRQESTFCGYEGGPREPTGYGAYMSNVFERLTYWSH